MQKVVQNDKRKAGAKTASRRSGRIRVRYRNTARVLTCYAMAWGLALLLVFVGLVWVYPYQLAHTAPNILQNLANTFPFLRVGLMERLEGVSVTAGISARDVTVALSLRDDYWRVFVGGSFFVCWLISLLAQLGWRSAYRHPLQVSRVAGRAIRTYRLVFLGIVLVNALGLLIVYLLGMQFIAGKGVWDFLLYGGGFALNVLAAWVCFRLAAPPAISGKRAFFKRL